MDLCFPLGSAADFVSGQRILSPFRGYLPHPTTRYQVVFTDVSVVKAKLRLAWYRHVTPSSSPHRSLRQNSSSSTHLNQYEERSWRRFFLRSQIVTSIAFNCTKNSVYPRSLSECRRTFPSCHNHGGLAASERPTRHLGPSEHLPV